MSVHKEGIERIIKWLDGMDCKEARLARAALRELLTNREKLEAWKADAERLAVYANHQTDSLNHTCGIYKNPRKECDCGIQAALESHHALVEKEKNANK